MALTQNPWDVSTVNGVMVAFCDVVATTAETISATLKTPTELDTSKAFTLTVNSAAASLDGATLPVDVYAGFSDSFALGVVTTTLTITDGFLLNPDVIADVQSAAGSVIIDPLLNISDDADDIVRGNRVAYYGFTLDGAGTLNAATCRFVIMQ